MSSTLLPTWPHPLSLDCPSLPVTFNVPLMCSFLILFFLVTTPPPFFQSIQSYPLYGWDLKKVSFTSGAHRLSEQGYILWMRCEGKALINIPRKGWCVWNRNRLKMRRFDGKLNGHLEPFQLCKRSVCWYRLQIWITFIYYKTVLSTTVFCGSC